MILALAFLSLGSGLVPNPAPVEASRPPALQNALCGIDLLKAANPSLRAAVPERCVIPNAPRGIDLLKAANPSVRAAAPERCVIPLVRVPVDPNIDPKIVLRVPDRGNDRMPRFKGPPICPARP